MCKNDYDLFDQSFVEMKISVLTTHSGNANLTQTAGGHEKQKNPCRHASDFVAFTADCLTQLSVSIIPLYGCHTRSRFRSRHFIANLVCCVVAVDPCFCCCQL